MGTCCVAGCTQMSINEEEKYFTLGGYTFHEGDYISIDGNTGKIYKGDIKTEEATVSGNFGRIMSLADKYRTLGIRTNADNPKDTKKAIELGAEGIGLCRTEHMFFEEDRIPKIRKMILSETSEERTKALNELIPFQKGDFKAMYKELKGMPMTVRYLDPPLHEFLPSEEEEIISLAKEMNVTVEHLKNKIAESDLSVETISQEIGISRSQLQRKLKQLTNQNPSDYIKTTRLRHAAWLLSCKNLSVSEVSYATGFSSLSHFSNSFKEFYGMSPSHYMEIHRSNRDSEKPKTEK